MLQVIRRTNFVKTNESPSQLNQLGALSILIGGCQEHKRLVRPATLIGFGNYNSGCTHPSKPKNPIAIIRDELSAHEHMFAITGKYDVVAVNLKNILRVEESRWRLVPYTHRQRGIWFLLWEPIFICAEKYKAMIDEQKDRLPPMNPPRQPIPPPDDSDTWYPGVL